MTAAELKPFTAKELIEELQKHPSDSLIFTMAHGCIYPVTEIRNRSSKELVLMTTQHYLKGD
jgi:hypothetical protein